MEKRRRDWQVVTWINALDTCPVYIMLMHNHNRLFGQLAGWKRQNSNHGIVMTLQVAANDHESKYNCVEIAISDAKLASLIRDLTRAAKGRGVATRQKSRLLSWILGAR